MIISIISGDTKKSAIPTIIAFVIFNSIFIFGIISFYNDFDEKGWLVLAPVILFFYCIITFSTIFCRNLVYSPVKFVIDSSGLELVQGSLLEKKSFFTHNQIISIQRSKLVFLRIVTVTKTFHFLFAPQFCKYVSDIEPSEEIKQRFSGNVSPAASILIEDAYKQLRKTIGIELQ